MLHRLRQDPHVEPVALVTTVNRTHGRVAMHAVREELLARQAEAAGLPLWRVDIPSPCTNEQYEEAMRGLVERALANGVTHMAFGDLLLEDVRAYRERMLEGTGLTPLFPLWGEPTGRLASEMIAAGLQARITCLDPRQVPRDFAGRAFDESLLEALPGHVDRCGEQGEFHTFAWAGPMFSHPVPVEQGETVERDGFVFTDLLPAGTTVEG